MASRNWLCWACLLGAICLCAADASAQLLGSAPKELQDVGIIDKRGAQVPLDVPFVDSNGRKLTLGQLLDGSRPTLLTLNYSNCPMLCSLQLNGLFDALGDMPWNMGDEFRMITVSIDPAELPQRAELTKQKYLKRYGRAGAAAGWRCLTGTEENIRKVANSVGFHYRFVPERNEYSHAAATMVLTPDGQVSRYMYGVVYDPQTVRLSLVEAGKGKVGSPLDQVILMCFHYDEAKGRYGPAANTVMRFGGVLTILGIGCMVLVFRRRSMVHRGGGGEVAAPAADRNQTESVG
jgi:protein SCO1/2